MLKKINTVAFDLGGVLAYQDFSLLTEEELWLFKIYMNRKSIKNKELVEYARQKIPAIYMKIHKLTYGAIPTLEMLKDMKIKTSIWTNNIQAIENWFEEIGLYKYINRDDVINSFYIGSDKPDLVFYYKALKILKCSPQSILFLDDKTENIISAEECGINGIVYNPNENLKTTVERKLIKGIYNGNSRIRKNL